MEYYDLKQTVCKLIMPRHVHCNSVFLLFSENLNGQMDFRCGTYRWNSIRALLLLFWAIRHCLVSRADAVFDWQVVSVLKSRRLQLSWKLVEAVMHVLLLWAGKSKINVGNSGLTAIDVSYCVFQPPLSLFFFVSM